MVTELKGNSALSRARLALAFVVFLAAVVLAFRVHAFFIFPESVLVGFDDRYIAPFGMRMLEGQGLPYVDAVSQRGPVLYWAVAAFQRIFGPFEWAALRWLALSASFVTMAGCFAVGVVVRKPLAGAMAAVVQAYVTTYGMSDLGGSLGIVGETVATPFSLLGLACTAWALTREESERRSYAWLALGGVFEGLAGMSKQTSLAMIAPLFVWTAIVVWTRGRSIARSLSSLVAGWALPIVAVLSLYVGKGALGTFWYWFYTYNAKIYMHPYASKSKLGGILSFLDDQRFLTLAIALPLVVAIVAPLARAKSFSLRELGESYASRGLELTIAMLTAMAFVSAFTPMRFWPHYFLTVVPFVSLLAGLALDAALGEISRWPSLLAHGVVGCLLVGLLAQGTTQRLASLHKNGRWKTNRTSSVCGVVQAFSQPSEPIFIWGFDGDFYVDCRRKPASRFVFTTMLAGVVAPRWGEPMPERIAPGAADLLEADLRASRPPLILDFYKSLGGETSMRKIPQLARFLDTDYCQLSDVEWRKRPAHVWVRRDSGRCSVPSP